MKVDIDAIISALKIGHIPYENAIRHIRKQTLNF